MPGPTLCQLPTCRQRNRHLPGCVDDCLGCLPRVTDEGLICDWCMARPERWLAEIIEFTEDARAVAHGEVRRSQGGGSGKPGSRPPLNVDAVDALDAIQNALTTMAREIADERGLQIDSAGLSGSDLGDPITRAAKWLSVQLSWLRHATLPNGEPVAADVFREIGDCAARMRSLVDGPKEQRFLGPCGAEIELPDDAIGVHGSDGSLAYPDDPMPTNIRPLTCEGDVYGVAGAQTGRCRTCCATVDQAERRQWLDDEVRARAFTAKDIADAYGINVKTIRSWATERQARWDHAGTLVQPARQAKLHTHGTDRDGRALFLVGDVLDLAADDAARREERRVERERRAARRTEMGA